MSGRDAGLCDERVPRGNRLRRLWNAIHASALTTALAATSLAASRRPVSAAVAAAAVAAAAIAIATAAIAINVRMQHRQVHVH